MSKGVTSTIIDDSAMPVCEEGNTAEIIMSEESIRNRTTTQQRKFLTETVRKRFVLEAKKSFNLTIKAKK